MTTRQFKTLLLACVFGLFLMVPLALFGLWLVAHFTYEFILTAIK